MGETGVTGGHAPAVKFRATAAGPLPLSFLGYFPESGLEKIRRTGRQPAGKAGVSPGLQRCA